MGVIDSDAAGAVMQLTGKGAEVSADIIKAFLNWLINIRSKHLENELSKEKIQHTQLENTLANENILRVKSSKLFLCTQIRDIGTSEQNIYP